MNEQMTASKYAEVADEWISALFDGELEPPQARVGLDRLVKDRELARQWSEYARVGDLMRGCGVGTARLDARVRAALANEPTILAPLPAKKPDNHPSYWMAAAAAVAAITWGVFSFMPAPEGGLPVVENSPAAGQAVAARDVTPYMVAHQDYAYAVVSAPEMRFTPVALTAPSR